jgi:hypothetical protein
MLCRLAVAKMTVGCFCEAAANGLHAGTRVGSLRDHLSDLFPLPFQFCSFPVELYHHVLRFLLHDAHHLEHAPVGGASVHDRCLPILTNQRSLQRESRTF